MLARYVLKQSHHGFNCCYLSPLAPVSITCNSSSVNSQERTWLLLTGSHDKIDYLQQCWLSQLCITSSFGEFQWLLIKVSDSSPTASLTFQWQWYYSFQWEHRGGFNVIDPVVGALLWQLWVTMPLVAKEESNYTTSKSLQTSHHTVTKGLCAVCSSPRPPRLRSFTLCSRDTWLLRRWGHQAPAGTALVLECRQCLRYEEGSCSYEALSVW